MNQLQLFQRDTSEASAALRMQNFQQRHLLKSEHSYDENNSYTVKYAVFIFSVQSSASVAHIIIYCSDIKFKFPARI